MTLTTTRLTIGGRVATTWHIPPKLALAALEALTKSLLHEAFTG